jgi:Ribosomal protein L21E
MVTDNYQIRVDTALTDVYQANQYVFMTPRCSCLLKLLHAVCGRKLKSFQISPSLQPTTATTKQHLTCCTHSAIGRARTMWFQRYLVLKSARRCIDFGNKEHALTKMSIYLVTYHVGDIVDIKANAGQQKGMPHKYSGAFRPVNANKTSLV